MILPYKEFSPKIENPYFIAPDAKIIGQVELGSEVSIYFGAVLRGDINPIRIGSKTNIQEHCVFHTTRKRGALEVGEGVTVGHRALLHGCRIESGSLIGMGAIILDDSVIEEECLVGAGALVTENKRFSPRSLIIGSPAREVRKLDESEIAGLKAACNSYVEKGATYMEILNRV